MNRHHSAHPCLVSAADLPAHKRRLIHAGLPWCEVAEHGFLRGGLKRRQLCALWPTTSAPDPLFQPPSTKRRVPAGLAQPMEAQP